MSTKQGLSVNLNFSSQRVITQQIKRICAFATNCDLIPISLHPNVVDIKYFKLSILLDQKI